MGKQFNLSEAAKEILAQSVSSKKGGQDGSKKLSGDVAYGTKEVGDIGTLVTKPDDSGPDSTRGVPTATPPGATPPVGAEPMKKLSGQPAQSQGRGDLGQPNQADALDSDSIRDRRASPTPKQTMPKNKGSVGVQTYEDIDVDTDNTEQISEVAEETELPQISNIQEDIDALLNGEDLSEEFRAKAALIFESAVMSRVNIMVEEATAKLVEEQQIAIEEIKEDFSEKLDEYLSYVAEEWMKENELAVESGLRSEISEDFLDGLRNLFKEHYIDIPEEKVDVVEEFASKINELEEELNSQIEANIEMKKDLNEHRKMEVLYTVSEGLTQTQVEKLQSLAESVDFTTQDEFTEKVETLKESFFGDGKIISNNKSELNEGIDIDEDKPVITDRIMNQYAQTISKTIQK